MSQPAASFSPFAHPSAEAAPGRVLWLDPDPARGERARRVLADRAIVDVVSTADAALAAARRASPRCRWC